MTSDTLRYRDRRRSRSSRTSVRLAERLARLFISVGGIGTILAVTLIFAFLLWVVLPLFRSSRLSAAGSTPSVASAGAAGAGEADLLAFHTDPYGSMYWQLRSVAGLDVRRLDNAGLVANIDLAWTGQPPGAVSSVAHDGRFALAYPDGAIRLARIGFTVQYFEPQDVPELAGLAPGERRDWKNGLIELTSERQLRLKTPDVTFEAPLGSEAGARILLLDRTDTRQGPRLAWSTVSGVLSVAHVENKENPATGETTTKVQRRDLASELIAARGPPMRLMLTGVGDSLDVVWGDGWLARYDLRDFDQPQLVEQCDLLEAPGARVTSLCFLAGRSTLAVGDSQGGLVCWFTARTQGAGTLDGLRLVRAHELARARPDGGTGRAGAAVTALAASSRSRVLASADAAGRVCVYYVPTEELRAEAVCAAGAPLLLAIAPKEDALCALTPAGLQRWELELGHPEASLSALFRPIWYEDYAKPEHVWQSSSGTDDVEPKYGLVPLIFGTLKATFYSLLFGVPLALLAALFTSEFLSPKLRTPIKSTVEIMASLPSVVLGFLAALIIAPLVQGVLSTVLALFLAVPLCLLGGAYLWQFLPAKAAVRMAGWQRLASIFMCLPAGILCASWLGPLVRDRLFGGSIEQWLDGRAGGPFPGWLFLLLPVCALWSALLVSRSLGTYVRRISVDWSRDRCASADLAQFALVLLFALGLALGAAALLSVAGFDPRGSVVGTYEQRNALVVGFVMGFAIIPLIYTLSEDALSSVPQHLRLASLGAGATPWQTAVRIVVPTAMSGLFSAVMVGLGRAVGETMVVLMATGNTAVMEWNVFNGFRTLSANIAVELPEAVRDSTHYRALFLAALVLFAMTFAVNTVAEAVRQRFRKRAYQL